LKTKYKEPERRENFVPVRLTATEFKHLEKVRKNIPRSTYLVSCYRAQEKLDK